ncbi:MAG: hypothetical protein K9H25_23915 [Rhodospirillum sp.]|nr:hypothetical protein [Rhodospirillum sp.]MCF8492142.1 hypothetical protein [Rhodospirillum sp.]
MSFVRDGEILRAHARLDNLLAHTDAVGEKTVVNVTRDTDGHLESDGTGGWSSRSGPVFPTNPRTRW